MGLLAFLDNLAIPERGRDEDETGKIVNDAVDRFILGSMKARAVGDISNIVTEQISDRVFGRKDYNKEKARLEVELLKRQIAQYGNDDSYQRQLNDESISPLLAAKNAQTYALRGKSLLETLTGDIRHANGSIVQRLFRLR